MKELSIEEKAKAYDEAIERGKQIQNTPYTAHWDTMKDVVEHLLPELKESEDKKMRRWIINYLDNKALNSGIIQEKTNIKNAIAWLEKQGELCEKCMSAPINSKERAQILTECRSQSCWYKGY